MSAKIYIETQTTLPVYDECDLLVVGGGCAGHSAAIAAARAGCKNIILMERYGYMGGDVTGGYVLMVPKLSWYDKSFCRGLQEEWFTRLDRNAPGSTIGPGNDVIGSEDPGLLASYSRVRAWISESEPKRLVRAVWYDPAQLKIELDKMLLEHSDAIRVMCHSWGTKPIMEGNVCRGVIFESKEGRKAILAKQVIDATGDADLIRQTGTEVQGNADMKARSSSTALVWRIGGVDNLLFAEWKRNHPEDAKALSEGFSKTVGFKAFNGGIAFRNDICTINNWHTNKNCADIKDATVTEMETRATMREGLKYFKDACPLVFKDAYIYDIAPQLGTRCSYRIVGDYMLTANDYSFAYRQDDVIAWHSTICMINDCGPVEIPFRTVLPKGLENITAPGRHLSADGVAIDWCNLIPQCIGTGQAAGVAAAVALKNGTTVRGVDIRRVQDILAGEQDVPLPRNEHTDKSYTELCEEHQYGLYTELAKAAAGKKDALKDYRQH